MATHTWNSVTFDKQTRVESDSTERGELTFAYPGVAGVDTIDTNRQVRRVVISGIYKDESIANVQAWFTTLRGKLGEAATLSLYGGAESLENCKMRFSAAGLRPCDGGYGRRYQVIFTQVQPNSV